MSTKKETKQTNQYDPISMAAFASLTGKGRAGLEDALERDPRKSRAFLLQLGMMQNQLGQLNQRDIWQLMQNTTQMGGGSGTYNPFVANMLARGRRAASSREASGLQNLLLGFEDRRQQAAGSALSYRPLQTGGTQVEKTSGLGTWLPQIVSAGLGAASGFATGGVTKGGGGGGFMGLPSSGPGFPGGGMTQWDISQMNPFLPRTR